MLACSFGTHNRSQKTYLEQGQRVYPIDKHKEQQPASIEAGCCSIMGRQGLEPWAR